MHTLSPNLLRQASSHNLANHISQSYESFNQKIYEMLFSACEWLIKHDFLKEVDSQGHFTFTEKGKRLKTLIEFKDFLSEEKSESTLSPNQITSNAKNNPKRTLSVFLCHSAGDKPAVRDLYNRLRSAADYISPWLDEEDLLPGQRWEEEIPKAVRESDVVIVCLSQSSINKKGYVQKEIKYALDEADEQPEGTIFIIPAKLEECQIPTRLSSFHGVNLFEERGFERLVRALSHRAEKPGINNSERPPSHVRLRAQAGTKVGKATAEGVASTTESAGGTENDGAGSESPTSVERVLSVLDGGDELTVDEISRRSKVLPNTVRTILHRHKSEIMVRIQSSPLRGGKRRVYSRIKTKPGAGTLKISSGSTLESVSTSLQDIKRAIAGGAPISRRQLDELEQRMGNLTVEIDGEKVSLSELRNRPGVTVDKE
jgi:hypothetical protein